MMKNLNDSTPYDELLNHIYQIDGFLERPNIISKQGQAELRESVAKMLMTVTKELVAAMNTYRDIEKTLTSRLEAIKAEDVSPTDAMSSPEEEFCEQPSVVFGSVGSGMSFQEKQAMMNDASDASPDIEFAEPEDEVELTEDTLPKEYVTTAHSEAEPADEMSPQELASSPAVTQIAPSTWTIDASQILCQKQEVVVTTKEGKELPIKLSISPMEIKDGLVPLMVNAEYINASYRQISTFKSEEGESLLVIDIGEHSFLLNGKFTNGKFSVSVMTTGRSVEKGDTLRIKDIHTNKGTAPVQEIQLCPDATLWISFSDNQYFGVLNSGEWTDEFNSNHDVMIEQNGEFSDLKLARDTEQPYWTLNF